MIAAEVADDASDLVILLDGAPRQITIKEQPFRF